jgi:hypothetical protein
VHNYATELLVNLGYVVGFWCLSWEFLYPIAIIRPPHQILPHVINLSFDSKLDIKLLQTFALVCMLES